MNEQRYPVYTAADLQRCNLAPLEVPFTYSCTSVDVQLYSRTSRSTTRVLK